MNSLYLRLRTLLVCWKIYGFGSVFFSTLFELVFLKFFNITTMFLDNIFFPRYRKIQVVKPVFIIGHPRSGTTFLHHLLTSTDDAVAFKTWHLFFPALTARALLRPLINFLIKKGKSEILPEWTGHRIALDKTEEEEMLFIHNYDTQFIAVAALGFDDREYPELHEQDKQSRSQRFRSMRFLDSCFKRHIYFTGQKQIIAQTHFSTNRIKTMMEYYPDAKFIYIVRNPHHVVPSFLSLLHNTIKFRWGLEQIPPALLQRYNQRRYQAMINLYRYFYDLQKNNEIPEHRVLVLQYDLLISDLQNAFKQIVEFTDIKASKELLDHIAARSVSQKKYQRKHAVMDLKKFGLTDEMIARDFSFVFEEYNFN